MQQSLKCLGMIKRIKRLLPDKSREIIFNTIVLTIFDYADVMWGDRFNCTLMNRLQIFKNKGAKLITGKPLFSSSHDALKSLGWKDLEYRRKFHRLSFIF